MSSAVPSVFVSHGSPMVSLDSSNPVVREWKILMKSLRAIFSIQAILIISAHFTSRKDIIITSRDDTYPLIYDYYGFPDELYKVQYQAKGSSSWAERIASRLNHDFSGKIPVRLEKSRGLDHGSFIPLRAMNPNGDLPVISISVPLELSIAQLIEIGKSLYDLTKDGLLVLGSGGENHSFEEFFANGGKDFLHQILSNSKRSQNFGKQLRQLVVGDSIDYSSISSTLANYREEIPGSKELHPTDEHFRPFFITLGASIPKQGTFHGEYCFLDDEAPTGLFLFHSNEQKGYIRRNQKRSEL